MDDPIRPARYRGSETSWLPDKIIEVVELTEGNFLTVEKWLNGLGGDASEWTNESFVAGIWLGGTWHDRGRRTPVPFGWSVYYCPQTSEIGAACPYALEANYEPA